MVMMLPNIIRSCDITIGEEAEKNPPADSEAVLKKTTYIFVYDKLTSLWLKLACESAACVSLPKHSYQARKLMRDTKRSLHVAG